MASDPVKLWETLTQLLQDAGSPGAASQFERLTAQVEGVFNQLGKFPALTQAQLLEIVESKGVSCTSC